MHNLHGGDDMEGEDEELDENDIEHDDNEKVEPRNLRKRPHQYFGDDGDISSTEHDDNIDEYDDDMDDGDGPENLCIKNKRNTVSSTGSASSSSKQNKDTNNSNSKNCSSNNNNRIGLTLKDIRHLNRPQSHCRQSLFAAFPPHHPLANQQQKDDHLALSSQRERAVAVAAAAAAVDHLQKTEHLRQSQSHSMPQTGGGTQSLNSQATFLESQTENLKREAIDARIESENAYMEQMDLQIAAAAAAAAAAHQQHNAANSMHHPNSRHPDLENNLHKDFTPSSPMSLQSHFNPREGPPHPPSPLQFPGMSSALTLTPPHHSKFSYLNNIQYCQ